MAEHQYDVKRKIARKSTSTTPASPQHSDALDLQRLIGNRGVQRLLQRKTANSMQPPTFIQTKLSVGAADDAYEQEADKVAKAVVNNPAADNNVQRAGEEEELAMKRSDIQREGEEEELAMKRADIQRAGEEDELALKRADIHRAGEEDELAMKRADIQRAGDLSGAFEVGGGTEEAIMSSKGSGQPLDDSVRGKMESGFGHDFSGVQVHTGSQADSLNRSLQARAFTTGGDIFFREGEYKPDSKDGQELLAHELTHVVQQGAASPTQVNKKEES